MPGIPWICKKGTLSNETYLQETKGSWEIRPKTQQENNQGSKERENSKLEMDVI